MGMRQISEIATIGLVPVAVMFMSVGSALAVPLPPDECLGLDRERASIESQGVLDDLASSPTGFGSMLMSSARVELIRHYLEVKEKVLFRCPNLIVLRPKDPEDNTGEGDQPSGPVNGPAAGPGGIQTLLKNPNR